MYNSRVQEHEIQVLKVQQAESIPTVRAANAECDYVVNSHFGHSYSMPTLPILAYAMKMPAWIRFWRSVGCLWARKVVLCHALNTLS